MIHFAYTVPRSNSLLRRAVDKTIAKTQIVPPLHRFGNDALIPWTHPIRAPHSISYHLLASLRERGPVRFYSMLEHTEAPLGPSDVFLGSPLPLGGFAYDSRPTADDPTSITSRTLRSARPTGRKILIMPYANDPLLVDWAKDLAENYADSIILIGGDIWTRNWESTPFGTIPQEKTVRLDMGIDMQDYPLVKKSFNPKGKRRYLYIGHTAWYKNTSELERIAEAIPNFEGAHIGAGTIRGWKKLANFATLSPEYMSKLAEEYDIFVSTSTADAQATTILEQMCFGLVVASTPETGYSYDSLVALSTYDTEFNRKELEALQYADESELFERAAQNRTVAATRHSWEQFTDTALRFIFA